MTLEEAHNFIEDSEFAAEAGSSLKKFWTEDVTP